MFEKMPVNIIDMAECGFEFATHIEKFVMTMSQVVSARPKMKKLWRRFLEGTKLIYKIWPRNNFIKRPASYHFKG